MLSAEQLQVHCSLATRAQDIQAAARPTASLCFMGFPFFDRGHFLIANKAKQNKIKLPRAQELQLHLPVSSQGSSTDSPRQGLSHGVRRTEVEFTTDMSPW